MFRSQVGRLTTAGQHYAATLRPLEALRSWMAVFIDYVAARTLILPAMDTVPGGSTRLIEGSRGPIQGTLRGLVQRAIDSGELRAGTDLDDIIRALIGGRIPGYRPCISVLK